MPHSEPLVGLSYFGFERCRDAGENESVTAPHTLNEDRRHLDQGSGEEYAVTRDGQRFLVNLAAPGAFAPPITLIFNWKPKAAK